MGNAAEWGGAELRVTLKFQEQLAGKLVKERRALRRECSKFGFQMGFREIPVQNVTLYRFLLVNTC